MAAEPSPAAEAGRDFIRDIVAADLAEGRAKTVVTRFPPEPNGYLHIGHAKSICLNFGIAEEFGGRCHLRFDDTNPTKEEREYIEAIERDVRWLGYDWGPHLYHASDYFERLYEWAEHLIRNGDAYVDDTPPDQMRAMRGTLTEPGTNSPYRDRSPAENLDLFRRMRAGEFPNGARVLRAKIDMAAGNINLRDPVLYRILHAEHPRTGRKWSIYPTYDFAHGQSDAIEGVTHSICTLEFEDHRPLRLADRAPAGAVAAAAIRVRPAQPELYGAVEAVSDAAGAGGPRLRLGRSAHADPRRAAAARRAGGGDPRVRPAARRGAGQQRRRHRPVRTRGARRAEPHGAAPDGGAATAEADHRQLPGGAARDRDRAQPSRRRGRRHARAFVRARTLHRARRFPRGSAQQLLPADAGARGAAALCLSRHLRGGGEGRGGRYRRIALHLRPGVARRQRAGRTPGARHDPLGLRRRCGGGGGAALQPAVHPARPRRRRRSARRPQPRIDRGAARLPGRAGACRSGAGKPGAVRAARLFLPRPRRGAGIQPYDRLARQLCKGASRRVVRRRGNLLGFCERPVGHLR